jgi:uncharacterized protein
MSRDSNVDKPALPDALLLEGIVTTLNDDGSVHIAPMGPIVDAKFSRLLLRPYQTSTTFQNLKRAGEGVLHVTDDVVLFARAAVGELSAEPRTVAAKTIKGRVLADACRWYEFRVDSLDDSVERTELLASVVERGRNREFFGFNRAKHAVIEAAILATRTKWLEADFIRSEFNRLAVIVEKTGGREEHAALRFLEAYVTGKTAAASAETAT